MPAEELFFLFDSLDDCKSVINLFLRSTFYAEVTKLEWVDVALQKVKRICSFVHEIYLCDHSNCPFAIRIHLSRKLEGIRVRQVCVGSCQCKNQRILRCNELVSKVFDLIFDISGLPFDRHLGHARKINHRQVDYVRRIYSKTYCLLRYVLVQPCNNIRLGFDLLPYFVVVVELLSSFVQELTIFLQGREVVLAFFDASSLFVKTTKL